MPGRVIPLINNQIYHIFNRGIDRRPTFTAKQEFQRAMLSMDFYRSVIPPMRLSKFLIQPEEKKKEILQFLNKSNHLVEVINFCFMPNHFHFLLKQLKDNGISKYLSIFQNSYTKFFNTRHKRDGSLFMDQFKAVRIETDEQLIHVSRYIHLNPYSGFVIKTIEKLESYQWSSFYRYTYNKGVIRKKNIILNYFRSIGEYKRFVIDQADYQKNLKEIEHLIFD